MYKKYTLQELLLLFPNLNFDWLKDNKINEVLTKLKGDFKFVGGCVRDSLLGLETKDIDVCTTLHPDEIENNLKNYHISVVGKRFGTIGVFCKNYQIEITTTREDIATYGREADVNFTTSFETDSERRDFTFNALLCDLDGNIEDYHNGIEDLLNRNVKFIGLPENRIQEDYLRILRYIRFVSRFGKEVNEEYLTVIKNNIMGMKILSSERIISEILLMTKKGRSYFSFKFINALNVPIEAKLYPDLYKDKNLKNIKLNENLNLDLTEDLKIASLFINFEKWNGLCLPKDVKYILKFKAISIINKDYFELIATSWYKNKDILSIDYINFWRYLYNKPIYEFKDPNNYNYDCSFLIGIIRGQIEVLARKLYLEGKSNIEIESEVQKFIKINS